MDTVSILPGSIPPTEVWAGSDFGVNAKTDDPTPAHVPEAQPSRRDRAKPDASIVPALNELERAFLELAQLFPIPIPLPVITIQSRGRRNALGWFSKGKWKAKGQVSEINISAEYLARNVLDIAETLIHEMVHYCNALGRIEDCNKQYHNRRFRDRALQVGLIVEQTKHGWAKTSLSPELRVTVEKIALDPEAFSIFRRSEQTSGFEAGAGSRQRRWKCGCRIIRVADKAAAASRKIDIKCGRCDQEFEYAPGKRSTREG